MKTKLFTLIAAVIAVTGSANISYASVKSAGDTSITLPSIAAFTRIEAHGNVEVQVYTGNTNSVTVNNNYYAENAVVQVERGILRVTSYKAEKLIVRVTAKDLESVAAYDNAIIRSIDKVAALSFDLKLYDNAYAAIDMDSFEATISLNGNAKADLTGMVEDYTLVHSASAIVNSTQLLADNTKEIAE